MAATKDSRITAKQLAWCRFVVQGCSDVEAYKKAYKASQANAEKNATRLRASEGVKRELEKLQSKADEKSIMSRQRRMKWLSDAIETPLKELDEGSNLVVEVTKDTLRGEDGDDSLIRKRIKKVDPLRAMDMLNKMDGEYAPTKGEISGPDGGAIPHAIEVTPEIEGRIREAAQTAANLTPPSGLTEGDA
mgnify:CR=1 FL=1